MFPLQTCTGDKDQATFNLKLALKLSGARWCCRGCDAVVGCIICWVWGSPM